MNHTDFRKCPRNFILKFSSLVLTKEITITLFHSHRNNEQWQIRLKSVLFGVRISNSPLLPFSSYFNIVHSLNVLEQTLFYIHLTIWYWILNVHVLNSLSMSRSLCPTMLPASGVQGFRSFKGFIPSMYTEGVNSPHFGEFCVTIGPGVKAEKSPLLGGR